jgi:hypothetical protein
MEIELKDFISESLKQIVDGVLAAQEYAKDKKAQIMPGNIQIAINNKIADGFMYTSGDGVANLIEFDIAVSASEAAQTKSGAGGALVTVLSASVQGQSEASRATVSRIRFTLPVVLPRQR